MAAKEGYRAGLDRRVRIGLVLQADNVQVPTNMFTIESLATATVAIIVLTSICSVIGFRHSAFRERHLFSVREILAEKQYHRLFTSAFLHADWNHLLLNMLSLFLFGRDIELLLGIKEFLLIYLIAVLGGSA